jgi:hypothetical protein
VGVLLLELKKLEREASLSAPSSAEAKNKLSYTHTPRLLPVMCSNKFLFILT